MVHRYYPDLPAQAQPITRKAARQKLMMLYFQAVGAATEADVRRLFQWKPREVKRTLEATIEAGHLQSGYKVEGQPGEHFVTLALLE